MRDRTRELLSILMASILGASFTYYLSLELGLGPILGASILAVSFSFFWPGRAAPAYCAAFAAQSSRALLPGPGPALILGLLCGLIFFFLLPVFDGYGGKLGTIAFMTTNLLALWIGPEVVGLPYHGLINSINLVLAAALGALFTYLISFRLERGVVMGSGLVSLAGGLITFLYPQLPLGAAVMCGSFTGMSSPLVVKNEGWLVVAGLFTGLLYIASLPVFAGFGGKMGTTALLGVLAGKGLRVLYSNLVITGLKG